MDHRSHFLSRQCLIDLFQRYALEGEKLWTELQTVINNPAPPSTSRIDTTLNEWSIVDDNDRFNDYESGVVPMPLYTLHNLAKEGNEGLANILEEDNLNPTGFRHWRVQNILEDARQDLPSFHFNQFYHVKQGIIIAANIRRKKKPDTPHWSEATIKVWARISEEDLGEAGEEQKLGELNWVFQDTVTSNLKVLIPTLLGMNTSTVLPAPKSTSERDLLQAGQFLACLGSPNGRGTAHLLIDHTHKLGLKTIESISINEIHPGKFMPLHAYHMTIKLKSVVKQDTQGTGETAENGETGENVETEENGEKANGEFHEQSEEEPAVALEM